MRASRPLGAAAEPLVSGAASGRGGGDQPLVFARAHTVSLSHAYTGCTPTQCSARSSSAAAASRSYCSAILSVCQSSRRAGQPTGTPLGLPAACPRPSMRPPPLRAHWRRSEPTARSHSGCGSAGASAPRNGASGAHLARRRGAAAGGVGRVCAVCAPRPRTLRRGGAPAALAHRRGRRGRAALRPLAVRPLRCVVRAAQRRRRLRRGGQGSATASRT